jgi:hypothetical protein
MSEMAMFHQLSISEATGINSGQLTIREFADRRALLY